MSRKRPEVGRLPRANFGAAKPAAAPPAPVPDPPDTSMTVLQKLDELIKDREDASRELHERFVRMQGAMKNEFETCLSSYEAERRELQALKTIFKASGLLVHDEAAMYNLATHQIGYADRGTFAAAIAVHVDGLNNREGDA